MNESKEFNDIVIRQHNGVMRIGINRPDKKNALTAQMYDAMRKALASASEDDNIKVVLFHGSKDAFTAGNDLKGFDNRDSTVPSPAQLLLHALHFFSKPVVAAVSGIAVGIGATLLLHCDLVYASTTRFRMPFVNLGVCPEGGSSLLLPQLAGHRMASEILMLGEFFDTSTAIELGLVNAELSTDEVLDHAITQAEKLAQQPRLALQVTKQLLKKGQQAQLVEHMREEFKFFGELLQSSESIEIREAMQNRTA